MLATPGLYTAVVRANACRCAGASLVHAARRRSALGGAPAPFAQVLAKRHLSNKPRPEDAAARERKVIRSHEGDGARDVRSEAKMAAMGNDFDSAEQGDSDDGDSSSSDDEPDDVGPNEQLLSKLLQETPRVVADDMLADAEASAPEPETITKFDLILDPYCCSCGGKHWTFECDRRSLDDWKQWNSASEPCRPPPEVVENIIQKLVEAGVQTRGRASPSRQQHMPSLDDIPAFRQRR